MPQVSTAWVASFMNLRYLVSLSAAEKAERVQIPDLRFHTTQTGRARHAPQVTTPNLNRSSRHQSRHSQAARDRSKTALTAAVIAQESPKPT